MKILLLACLCVSCISCDKSDQLPDFNRDKVTTINNININLQLTPKRHSHKVDRPGPLHPKVEAAHEALRKNRKRMTL